MKILRKAWFPAFALMTGAALPVLAADPAPSPPAGADAQTDAIVKKLEASGALDRAVERAIDRYVKRKDSERQAEQARRDAEGAKRARPVDLKRDHVRGNPNAIVTLIEYTDFECPFCKQFHGTPKTVLDRYGDRVNWVVRNYPLPFHDPAARKEALAAECVAQLAGNDAYWKYADALFANTRSNGAGLPDEHSTEKLADAVGVNASSLNGCVSDAKGAAAIRVDEDLSDGAQAGVSGTPATVVRNNKTGASQAVVGALPAQAFTTVIDRMLDAKP